MKVENIKYTQTKPFDGLIENPLKNGPESMKWILLGTGNQLSGHSRTKAANVLLAGEKIFLIDCGTGVIQRLIMAGIQHAQISHLFFTHQHVDHNGGFIDFYSSGIFSREVAKRLEPLNIYGPTNTKEIIRKMRESLDQDLRTRRSFDEDSNKIIYKESNDGLIYNDNGLKVEVFTVDHGDFKPAVGYRFSFNNKVIVFSGDTAPCENIKKYSKDADILIHESYNIQWNDRVEEIYGNSDTGRGFKGAEYKHTSTLEAAKIAENAGVRHLVLTHHIPSITPESSFEKSYIEGMSEIYSGKITMGRDLMMIS
ncbi:MBL fold metallo-hydrolase [Actinomycetota bacterium]